MSDLMLFGVLKMPYEMAMENELSRHQFYERVQELVGRFERSIPVAEQPATLVLDALYKKVIDAKDASYTFGESSKEAVNIALDGVLDMISDAQEQCLNGQPAQVQQDETIYQFRWNKGESFGMAWSSWEKIDAEEYARRLKYPVPNHELRILYTRPQAAPLRTLTDAEIANALEVPSIPNSLTLSGSESIRDFVRAILAAAGAAPVAQTQEALKQRDIAIGMLARWCVAIDKNGVEWDDWDEHYKDAAYRPGPLRQLLDDAIKGVADET